MGRIFSAKVILAFFLTCMVCINVANGQGYPVKKKGAVKKLKYVQAPSYQPTNVRQGLTGPVGKVPDTITGCYTDQQYWPSVRLPNSLDNLVYIVEKIEDGLLQQNMSINASFVANLILRRFQINGIIDIQDSETKSVSTIEQIKQDIIFRLFPDIYFSFPENVLTAKEKCGLHWMVSTSINTSNLDPWRQDYDPSVRDFPRENGAIYGGKYGSFSAGPLLSGIAASSNLNVVRVQDMVDSVSWSDMDASILGTQIDPVLVASLAGEIGQSVYLYGYPMYTHAVFGPEASWNGTVCPTTFSSIEKYETAATKAELLGATDGMIIGDYLRKTFYRSSTLVSPSLSQTLRSYYGRGLEMSNYYGCDRTSQANQLMAGVTNSAFGFAVVYEYKKAYMPGHQFPDHPTLSNFMSQAVGNFTTNYLQNQQFGCDQSVQTRQCETMNDIIFVMDTSVTASINNFQEQKNFIGTLIQRIGVFPNDSHVGVVTFGSSKEPIPFHPEQSGAEIRCQLQWTNLYSASTDVPQTIRYVMDKFKSIKNIQRSGNYPQAPGKVVVFIYLQSNLANSDQVSEAMDEFRAELPDVTTLAVGKNKDILRNFVVDDGDIFNQAGEQLSINVDQIIKRLCKVPITIEYKNCLEPNREEEAELVVKEFVYQDTYKWLGIQPWTMNRSEDLYLNFETQYGGARFCVGREISDDTNGLNECYETSTQTSVQSYGPISPCSSYEYDCPWFYISVRGKSGGTTEKCKERGCDSLNQIKFTVTHTGLTCAGYRITAALSIVFTAVIAILSTEMFHL